MDLRWTLERLNKEKDYEDKLVSDLSNYFITSLENIEDMTNSEKQKVDSSLRIIIRDSEKHAAYFAHMISKVVNHGEDDY
ncbi:hypothetical protein C0585_04790 [Candidatus Woesearchaeota archaeon]|nr:MAG: hypothetical protein C0585_04790 [Candidatus Woesearchaeota archaeon]